MGLKVLFSASQVIITSSFYLPKHLSTSNSCMFFVIWARRGDYSSGIERPGGAILSCCGKDSWLHPNHHQPFLFIGLCWNPSHFMKRKGLGFLLLFETTMESWESISFLAINYCYFPWNYILLTWNLSRRMFNLLSY